MLSENPKELFDLLRSIPGENPRVCGCGYCPGKFDGRYPYGGFLYEDADDFSNTEALFKSSITPSQSQPLLAQD